MYLYTTYIVSANGDKYAIAINDTTGLGLFLQNFPEDSTIGGPPNNNWDSTKKISSIKQTLYSSWISYQNYFLKTKHYEEKYVIFYTNILMITELLKFKKMIFYKEVNGIFKKVYINVTIKENKVSDISVLICN